MNKAQLAAAVATRLGISKTTAEASVAAVLDIIQGAVASGDKVQITGFGAFEQVHKPAHVGRVPSTGAAVQVAESWAPKFKAGTEFKARVNEGGKTSSLAAV